MMPSPYDLFLKLQEKGYVPPMAAQITVESLTKTVESTDGKSNMKFVGTGEHLKSILENDRVNVFKMFYDGGPDTESTWLTGDEPGRGMMLPQWAERLIHADVMVMKEKIDTTMDYLIHCLSKTQ